MIDHKCCINMTGPASRTAYPRLLLVATCAAALLLTGCRRDDEYAAGLGAPSLPTDTAQRFPIAITQEPEAFSLRVSRNASGLTDTQAAQVAAFMGRYRSYGESRSRLVVDVPVGSTNETAAIVAAKDIRQLGDEAGLSPNAILISKYRAARDTDATIKISFLRTAAHGPECGSWPTNLADQPDNANYDNFGCAQQHNLAAMIANPSDLVTPQGATPTSGERRGVIWEKYIKGESTVAAKSASEQVSTTSK